MKETIFFIGLNKAKANKKQQTDFRVRDRVLAGNTEQVILLLQYLSLPSGCVNDYRQI